MRSPQKLLRQPAPLPGQPYDPAWVAETEQRLFPADAKRAFHFTEIAHPADVLDYLKLRYQVYRSVNFIAANPTELDLDSYDFFSTYLGAWLVDGEQKRLVGGMRIIDGCRTGPHVALLARIMNDHGIDRQRLPTRKAPLPILDLFKLPAAYPSAYTSQAKGAFIWEPFEASRLVVERRFWRYGVFFNRALQYLTVANRRSRYGMSYDILVAVHPRRITEYARVGFKRIPGTGETIYQPLGQPAITLRWNPGEFLLPGNPHLTCMEPLMEAYDAQHSFTLRSLSSVLL